MQMKTKTAKETRQIAEIFAATIKDSPFDPHSALIIALEGELGAGKTTFTQSLARFLGVRRSVQSPTFVLMKRYPIKTKSFKNLWHVDCYRVESLRELEVLGFRDILRDPDNIICIEWADKISAMLPKNRITIKFDHEGEQERSIRFSI